MTKRVTEILTHSDSHALIVHPDVTEMRRRIHELRLELAALFERRMHLTNHVLPEIRARYASLFSSLEQQIQNSAFEHVRKQRLVQLLAVKLDRGERVDERMVRLAQSAVDREYPPMGLPREPVTPSSTNGRNGWVSGNSDIKTSTGASRTRHAAELRKLFLYLAKRLHPDSGSAHATSEKSIIDWNIVLDAHKDGDINTLRAVAAMVHVIDDGDITTSSFDKLVAAATRMSEAVQRESRHVESILQQDLILIADKLDDEGFVRAHNEKLEAQLRDIAAEIKKCDTFLAPYLALRSDATIDGQSLQQTHESDLHHGLYFTGR